MTCDAVPALKPSANVGLAEQGDASTAEEEEAHRITRETLALSSFAIALSRIASLSGPARATVGSYPPSR